MRLPEVTADPSDHPANAGDHGAPANAGDHGAPANAGDHGAPANAGDHDAGTILDVLLASAAVHADRVAVEDRDDPPLTYATLFARARAVAATLRDEGVGPGDLVALAIEKSAAYIAALLGVWLAGAAFFPLDPSLPPDRRLALLADAKPRRILIATDVPSGSAELPAPGSPTKQASFSPGGAASVASQGTVLAASSYPLRPEVRPGPESLAHDRAEVRPGPESLAYVVFTSGSTGAPKGVLVAHRGLPALVRAQIPAFELGPGARVLFHLSTSFDASISDIATALCSGATLVIADPAATRSARGLLDVLAERRITHADLPPSLLPAIDPSQLPSSFRVVVIGGEVCPPEAVRRWAERARVVNVYGPTEATICSSLCLCDARAWSEPLIGDPLPGVVYRIVDPASFASVASGEPGELLIGGACLSLGYLGRPELTAARFVEIDGQRLYRTGDRVLARADGAIVFLGRLDRQVKLRGRRIELAEIEAHLGDHPAVREAAVVARPLSPSRAARAPRMLVAFLTPRETQGEPAHEHESVIEGRLRQALSRALPPWMIPARFCFVSALPRTAAGKVDLASLAALPLARPRASAPVWTGAAAVLAAIWCEVLGTEDVAAEDDFFAFGGDSVALVELVARAEASGLPLSAEQVTRCPSFGAAAAAVVAGAAVATAVVERRIRDVHSLLAGLPERIPGPRSAGPSAAGSILVTGAAGGLGTQLVNVLVAHSRTVSDGRVPTPIVGLVRAHHKALPEGVRAVVGSLEQPRLGQDEASWRALAENVETLFHAAARVDGVRPYEALFAANVGGTREVLRLVREGRSKRLCHVSTLSVLAPEGGYAESKRVAEDLVRDAEPEATIVRLGLLAPGDHLTRFFRGLREIGCAPAPFEALAIDVTPAPYAAAAIVALASEPGTFHVANPEGATLADVVAAARAAGASVDEVSPATFRDRGGARASLSPDAAIAYLSLCRALGEGSLARHRGIDLFEATGLRLHDDVTAAALARAGIAPPPPARDLLVRAARAAYDAPDLLVRAARAAYDAPDTP